MPVSSLSSTAAVAFRPPAVASPNKSAAGSPAAAVLQPQVSRLLDAKLGISILQFRDTNGNVAQTLPSQQQLAAYAKPGAVLPSVRGQVV